MSESEKYLHMTKPYLSGNGVDCGSGGWPVVPWAIQVELPGHLFKHYTGRDIPETIEWQGDIASLPFKDGTLDFVYASHLIEDFPRDEIPNHPKRYNWPMLFREWRRVLKPGGNLICLVPEFHRWKKTIELGQVPNCSHEAPEPLLGDMTRVMTACGFMVLFERMTNLDWRDYSILAVAVKPNG